MARVSKRAARREVEHMEELGWCPREINNEETLTLVSAVCQILDIARDSQYDARIFELAARPITYIKDLLDITPQQAVVYAIVMNMFYDSQISTMDISHVLDISPIKAISFSDDLDELCKRKYLIRNYDDEGVAAEKTYMVKDGVLTSYLHDRISASWYGVKPTGNGRRENFRYNPIPRMRATYMESGNADPKDIIAEVKQGIYVDEFSNGQVKIGEGDFTFFVKSGYLIEDGRLTMPVKDINIIGNGPQALADILAVGNDLKIDNGTWTCGKEQSVAVSCGMPTIMVRSLTVGGEQ